MQNLKDNIIQNFIDNLKKQGKSFVSIKNYKSDITHFLAWSSLKIKSFGSYVETYSQLTPFLNKNLFTEYKTYLSQNNPKNKTVNRRLSSLRSLSRYLFENQITDEDYMLGIQNVGISNSSHLPGISTDIVERFRKSLVEKEKVSANTVKNYVSDIKGFLDWLNTKGELPHGI